MKKDNYDLSFSEFHLFRKFLRIKLEKNLCRSISIQYLLKISKVVTINNGTVFLNNFSGSKIEEGVPFKLKVTDHSELSIAQVQEENSGT